MIIEIPFLGKTKEKFLVDAIEEYRKRLSHYTEISLKTIKCRNLQGSDAVIKGREADLLLENLTPGTYIVALDPLGREHTSESFAARLDQWDMQNARHVTFLIGGPLGLADSILRQANEKISLSRMTFTHDMARFLLLEQLYRAFTIRSGEKYHK